jgi:hypothetical protein
MPSTQPSPLPDQPLVLLRKMMVIRAFEEQVRSLFAAVPGALDLVPRTGDRAHSREGLSGGAAYRVAALSEGPAQMRDCASR